MKSLLLMVILAHVGICGFAQIGQRLIAKTRYEPDSTGAFIAMDSVHFRYSGTRHSTFDHNILDFWYYPTPYSNYNLFGMPGSMNNIDSSHFYTEIQADSLESFVCEPFIGPGLHIDHTEGYSYNADGTLGEVRKFVYDRDTAPRYTYKQIAVYSSGKLIRSYSINQNVGRRHDTAMARYIIRHLNGQTIVDSITVYDTHTGIARPYNRTIYSYNASGMYSIKTLEDDIHGHDTLFARERTTNTYYPDGKLKTQLSEYARMPGILNPARVDSFEYTPGTKGYTSMKSTQLDTLGVATGVQSYYRSTLDALNRKALVTTTIVSPGQQSFSFAAIVAYNSYGNPETKTVYDVTSAFGVPFEHHVYYYELYDQPTQVTNAALAGSLITLSPNPTTGTVTLRHPATTDRLQVTIINSLGQIIHSEAFVPQGSSRDITLGNGVTPGLYYISVRGSNGAPLYNGSFFRQ